MLSPVWATQQLGGQEAAQRRVWSLREKLGLETKI